MIHVRICRSDLKYIHIRCQSYYILYLNVTRITTMRHKNPFDEWCYFTLFWVVSLIYLDLVGWHQNFDCFLSDVRLKGENSQN